jgi:hypothetical protein
MADDHDDHGDHGDHGDHDDHGDHPHGSSDGRTTAPQSEYSMRDVALGAVVAAVGLAATFGIPLLLA